MFDNRMTKAQLIEAAGRQNERLTQAEGQLAHLRQAIQNVLDGNYPSPRSHRPGKCGHGLHYYECCERCIDEYLIQSLKEVA